MSALLHLFLMVLLSRIFLCFGLGCFLHFSVVLRLYQADLCVLISFSIAWDQYHNFLGSTVDTLYFLVLPCFFMTLH